MRLERVVSLLLDYPTGALVEARRELREAVAGLAGAPGAHAVARFLEEWGEAPLDELQRTYVETFDFDARASLHLTYHLHGDRRRRGLELVRLKRRFAEAGLELESEELPDYLPLVLEFAALAPGGEGATVLSELRVPLELVRSRLRQRGSPFAHLLDAVVAGLPRLSRAEASRLEALAAEGPPTKLVGLDPAAPLEPAPLGGAR